MLSPKAAVRRRDGSRRTTRRSGRRATCSPSSGQSMERSSGSLDAGSCPTETQPLGNCGQTASTTRASVIMPAHNEEGVIGTALARLTEGVLPDEFQILVVCNGCTDGTAEVAQSSVPLVRVIDV